MTKEDPDQLINVGPYLVPHWPADVRFGSCVDGAALARTF
jgi:hypothetical protein